MRLEGAAAGRGPGGECAEPACELRRRHALDVPQQLRHPVAHHAGRIGGEPLDGKAGEIADRHGRREGDDRRERPAQRVSTASPSSQATPRVSSASPSSRVMTGHGKSSGSAGGGAALS